MQAKFRHLLPSAFLLTLLLVCAGCNRPPARTAQGLNSNRPATADQQTSAQANQTGDVQSPAANSAPTLANSQNNAAQNVPAATGNNAPSQPLIIPSGTPVVVRLQQSLSSASAVAGERFNAVLDQPLAVDNQTIAPIGTPVSGHVVVARHSGRLHHPGEIALTLDSITLGQQQIPVVTSSVMARGGSHKKRNLGWIGGGTGGGALIGALAGGGKGALIGGGIGAVAGTTTALFTGKKDVTFGAERRLTFRLHREITLQG